MAGKSVIIILNEGGPLRQALMDVCAVQDAFDFRFSSELSEASVLCMELLPLLVIVDPEGFDTSSLSAFLSDSMKSGIDFIFCSRPEKTLDISFWNTYGVFKFAAFEKIAEYLRICPEKLATCGCHKKYEISRLEEGLKRRDKLLEGVAGAANALLTGKGKDESFQNAINILGAATSVSRSSIFEFEHRENDSSCRAFRRYEWVDGRFASQKNNKAMLEGIPIDGVYNQWYHTMKHGGVIKGLVSQFTAEEQKLIQELGVKSLLIMPIITDEKFFWGFICLEQCSTEHEWADSEITILNAASADIAAAVVRYRMDEELRQLNQSLESRIQERMKDLLNEVNRRSSVENKLRQAYDALREQLEFQQMLLDTVPMPIFFKNKDLQYIDCNIAMCTFLGLQKADVIGRTLAELSIRIINNGQVEKAMHDERMLLADGRFTPHEIPLNFVDGSVRNVILNKARFFDNDGKPAGLIGVLIDITEQKRAEMESELRLQQLMQADKLASLGRLIAGVAHEINNPANFITMNVPILKELWENILPFLRERYESEGDFELGRFKYSIIIKHIDKLLSGISDGVIRINNIITELKDYTRPDKISFDKNLDINSIVKNAVSLLKNTIRARTENFSVLYGQNLPSFTGSAQKIEQVIINLINNSCEALEYTSQPIAVETVFHPELKMIAIVVKDGGQGISPEDQKHILDPFFTTKRERGGTGLGLSVSQKIIEMHGGRLEFSSKSGQGTEMVILLPAAN